MRLQIVLDRFLIRIQLVAILWQPKLFGLVLKPLSDMWTQHNKKNLVRLSATVTPKFFPLYHFFPLFSPLFFHLPQRFLLNTPSIPHYHYKISFSISTINFLSTNNYSWTHSTVFRVMNSDTLDLGEREGDRHVGCAVGGTAAAIGCPLQPTCKGRGSGRVDRCGQSKTLI
jgi:hypothetical protein